MASTSSPVPSHVNRRLVTAILVGIFLFVALNAWLALRAVESLESSQKSVSHTLEVIVSVERIMSVAKDAETGSRGYVLTGENRFLKPYIAAGQSLPGALANFQHLTVDNPNQQSRGLEMQALADQRIDLLEQSNAMRSPEGRIDTVQTTVLMETGKAIMDHMRQLADDMETEERRLLALRTEDAAAAALRVRLAIGLASLLDFLLLFFMTRYFFRERNLRLNAEVTALSLAESRVEIERKATEIQALNDSLELRVRQRTAELETTNKELEAFSYSVSHDLRAPLRTIDGFSLALEEDYGDIVGKEGKDYIQRVRVAVQRMGGLIDALLQLSRITRADIERQPTDLSELAGSVAQQTAEQNPAQKIAFTIQPGLQAEADPRLLRVAFENLFNNAAKFSSRKPESLIHFGFDPEKNAYFIRDNGAGFDMHYKDKLFGAFNRLHGDKDFKGSGIGLATVARVVRRHHGTIWAESELDQGATFWFTLG